MARSHGKIVVGVWIDPDFIDLRPLEQWVLMMLIVQPRSSTGPTFTYDPVAWASLAAGLEPSQVIAALGDLERTGWLRIGEGVVTLTDLEHLVLPTAVTHVAKERARLTLEVRCAVFERDGAECRACGALSDLSIDHTIPLSLGGTSDLDNLAILCRSCNSSKGVKPWAEWIESRGSR